MIAFSATACVPGALQTLVGQPIASRWALRYHRDLLDGYRSNATFYRPVDVRALADACRPVAHDGRVFDAAAAPVFADLARHGRAGARHVDAAGRRKPDHRSGRKLRFSRSSAMLFAFHCSSTTPALGTGG